MRNSLKKTFSKYQISLKFLVQVTFKQSHRPNRLELQNLIVSIVQAMVLENLKFGTKIGLKNSKYISYSNETWCIYYFYTVLQNYPINF